MRPSRALLVLALLDLIRLGIHFAIYRDRIGLVEIGALDACALLTAAIACALGPRVGEFFGSVALAFVCVGLPLALFGYLCDALGRPHLSKMMAHAGLIGVGAGLLIATARRRVLALAGAAVLAGGCYGLFSIHQPLESGLFAAPAALTGLAWGVFGLVKPRAG